LCQLPPPRILAMPGSRQLSGTQKRCSAAIWG
jgi:hypothetical protein